MTLPPRRERAQAWLRYEVYRLNHAWLQLTGRCPACRQRHGQHKFGCSRRPGKGIKLSVRREP